MENLLLAFCYSLSCFIVVRIMFQFMNDRYSRTYKNKYIYYFTEIIAIIIISIINLFELWALNLATWIIFVFAVSSALYYDEARSFVKCGIECEVLLLCICVSETFGLGLIDWILKVLRIDLPDSVMRTCLEITFGKIVVIFIYYIFLSRLMNKTKTTNEQLLISLIILAYSLANTFVIAEALQQNQNQPILAVSMGCIVLGDLYLLYFLKVSNEKRALEGEVKMLEQQADMQYAYYLSQEKKYNATMNILHDVNKHIASIENLYAGGEHSMAAEYVKEINDMLKPLTPVRHTGNPILDILLTDKVTIGREKGICFEISANNVDLNFLDAIDATTIFGNLIDNAMEAAEKVKGEKFVHLKLSSFQDMVILKVENSSLPVKMKNGIPISDKGKNHGIGLLNVKRSIEKYDGNITFKQQKGMFIVDILLNS